MTANGYVVSFWGDKNVLKFNCGDVAQFCKYTKNHYIVKEILEYDLVILKM